MRLIQLYKYFNYATTFSTLSIIHRDFSTENNYNPIGFKFDLHISDDHEPFYFVMWL